MYLSLSTSRGTYSHAVGEAALTVSRRTTQDAAGRINGLIETWGIAPQVTAASDTALTTALDELYVYYYGSTINSIGLYHDSGARSHHYLSANGSVAGIQVMEPPSFPDGRRDQYVVRRDLTITLQAEYPLTGAYNVIAWTETVSVQGGGGPRIVAVELREEPPQMQTVSQYTPVHIIQSGNAVGRFSRPMVPPPLLPSLENSPDRQYAPGSATLRGNRYENFPVSWSYHFILPALEQPNPHPWPKR